MAIKVLLIEGDNQVRDELSRVLRDNQFDVSMAKDGPTGLQVYKHSQPEVIVSNLILGDMTAVDVCEKIRGSSGDNRCAIILVANSSRSQKYMDGITNKYRIARWLQKPLSPADLLQTVQEVAQSAKTGSAEAAPAKSVDAEFKDIKPDFFPGHLLLIHYKKSTGVMKVKKGSEEKSIFFKEGNAFGVESKLKGEQLGQVLVQKGVITEKDYLNGARVMVEEGLPLGEALVKLGCLKKELLEDLIVDHQIHKIANCFIWLDADLNFQPQANLPSIKNSGAIELSKIFLEGLASLKRVTNLAQLLKPIEKEFVATNALFDRYKELLHLSAQDKEVLDNLRTAHQVAELLNPKTERFIAHLYLSGMVFPKAPDPAALVKRLEELKTKSQTGTKKTEQAYAKLKEDFSKLTKEKSEHEKSLQEKQQALEAELQMLQEEVRASLQRQKDLEDKLKTSATERPSASAPGKKSGGPSVDIGIEGLEGLEGLQDWKPEGEPAANEPLSSESVFDASDILDLAAELESPPELKSATPNPDATMFLGEAPLGPEELSPGFSDVVPPAAVSGLFGDPDVPIGDGPATAGQIDDRASGSEEVGIFDLASDLEGSSGSGAPLNPDSTIAYAPPQKPLMPPPGLSFEPTPEPALQPPGPPPAAQGNPLENIEQEFDQVFDGLAQTDQAQPTAPSPSPPSNAPPAIPPLPIDPFAPQSVRKSDSGNGASPPGAGSGKDPLSDEVEDFFSIPSKP